MFAWLLVLVIFWKPVYKYILYLKNKDPALLQETKDWFRQLWALVKP